MRMLDANMLEHILLALEQLLAQGVSPPASSNIISVSADKPAIQHTSAKHRAIAK